MIRLFPGVVRFGSDGEYLGKNEVSGALARWSLTEHGDFILQDYVKLPDNYSATSVTSVEWNKQWFLVEAVDASNGQYQAIPDPELPTDIPDAKYFQYLVEVRARDQHRVVGMNNNKQGNPLFCWDIKTNKVAERQNYDVVPISLDSEHIYCRTLGVTTALDFELNELWRFEPEGMYGRDRPHYFGQSLFLWGDVVIVAGIQENNHGRCALYALDKHNGNVQWERWFSPHLFNVALEHGKLYVGDHTQALVLDIRNGKILVNRDTGFQDDPELLAHHNCREKCSVYPIGDYLCVIAHVGNAIRFFSADGQKLIKEIRCQSETLGLSLANNQPVERFGKLYFRLEPLANFANALGGLLEIDTAMLCDGIPDYIAGMEFRDMDIEVLKADTKPKSEEYRLTIRSQNIDEILRLGEYAIDELAFLYGYDGWRRKTVNRKFNGHIHVVVQAADVDRQKLAELLTVVAGRVSDRFRNLAIAGNRKAPIHVTWEIKKGAHLE